MNKNILLSLCVLLSMSGCSTIKSWFDSSPQTTVIIQKISAETPKIETKIVYFDGVHQYSGWDERNSGVAVYTAESGWVITDVKVNELRSWQRSGYSLKKIAADSASVSKSVIEDKFSSAQSAVAELWKNEVEKKKISAAINDAADNFRKTSDIAASSHSKVEIHWKAEGSRNRFDQKRGQIWVKLDITLVKVPNETDVDKYIEVVKEALKK
ncbi:hypothetical protein [Rheinheimera sp. UJ63]|uniref:hypothetical protein n=1 Tax=Rheinheimera sp. UJ63 TaxID=2910157 RepID=UPI001F294989|nr:hypothetical protein [Rheinheimera sp. UJ63]MCF4010000.1 hypothetical protein [Rheinheimera sp. UJ63]